NRFVVPMPTDLTTMVDITVPNILAPKVSIPAQGWLILENYYEPDPSKGAAKIRPLGLTAGGNFTVSPTFKIGYVANLHMVLENDTAATPRPKSRELILLRPVNDTAVVAKAEWKEMVPVDTFDFNGFPTPMKSPTGGTTEGDKA